MSRVRLHKAEAIVLKRHDYGEADRILTVFTRERGKITVIAKGVRRIASRKAGHIELFTHAAMLLAEGRSMDVLTQVEMIDAFAALRDDLVRTTYAYLMAEIVDRFEHDGHVNAPAFDLLRDSLAALGAADDPAVVARWFELRYLDQLGYRPHFFDCAVCATPLEPGDATFSPDAGGVVCAACRSAVADGLPLDDAAFRVLRFLQSRELALARQVVLQPATRGQVEQVMQAFVRHHLERDLRSNDFLTGLRRAARTVDLQPSPGRPTPPSAGDPPAAPAPPVRTLP